MGSKSPYMILMVLPLVSAIIPLAAAVGGVLPPAIAQEETSLGEEGRDSWQHRIKYFGW